MYQNFPNGHYYLIFNKTLKDQCLKVQQSNYLLHHNSHIVAGKPNFHDNSEIFMIENIKKYENLYEFVVCISDYVFDEQNKEIVLKSGKQSKSQLFEILPCSQQKQYFWIKCKYQQGKALSLQGCLRVASFDPYSQCQCFRFEQVTKNVTIQNSCLIINQYYNKVIDVPQSSLNVAQRIILWQRNNRWNQRWFFQKVGLSYLIRSIISGLCLTIQGKGKELSTKILQCSQTLQTTQLWNFQLMQNGLYKIRSQYDQSLYLGVKHHQFPVGYDLVISDIYNKSICWRIYGALPN